MFITVRKLVFSLMSLILCGQCMFAPRLRAEDIEHANRVVVRDTTSGLHIDNGLVAVDLQKIAGCVVSKFKARNSKGQWQDVCESFRPDFKSASEGNKFFDTTVTPYRYQASALIKDYKIVNKSKEKVIVKLIAATEAADIEQTISLKRDTPYFHIEVSGKLKEPLLDYLMSSFVFHTKGKPEFIHTPTIKKDDNRSGPAVDQVIGDHAFHSPAVILQEGGLFVAMVPDLEIINQHRVISPDARRNQRAPRNRFSVPIEDDKYTMPTALDLNIRSGLTDKPVFSYGLMDFVVSHHIRYQRFNNDSMIRKLNDKKIKYGFDLFIGAEEPKNLGYQKISRHLWTKYGHTVFQNRGHLAMPFAEYVKTVYGVVSKPMDPKVQAPVAGYEDHGVFIDFEMNGESVGGMVSPLGVLGFGDALWNFEFWNNVRDASGMYYWGKKLNMPKMAERGKRIINLALQAPQNEEGFFCLVYKAQEKKWYRSSLGPHANANPNGSAYTIFAHTNQVYNVPAMSKTAAHMLEFYQRCDKDKRIVKYLSKYANGLITYIADDGMMPSYFKADMEPLEALRYSAQPVASMWFLAELYNVTNEKKYLDGAEKIAKFIIREIMPNQKWIDLEPYFSCGQNPFSYLGDDEQGLGVRGNLSTFWATKGFAALYRATHNENYLKAGEQAIDYVTFTQACWQPHYVYTAFPFGGFTVDNIDTATWLDARQCEMVEPFIWYGQILGRQDLIERGVAAARSSTVLINHPLHKANNIYRHTNFYGFALGPENINHEGHNQSAMRTHPSWGECSGIFTGLADADRILNGCYIDIANNLAVGVDGVRCRSFSLKGNRLKINIDFMLAKLNTPWNETYSTTLQIVGYQGSGDLEIIVNNLPPIQVNGENLQSIPLQIMPE